MSEPNESVWAVAAKVGVVIAGAVGSITLAQVASFMAILSGLVAVIYGALNTYLLWRDRIKGKKHAID